jgi:hypothetical protein
MIRIPVTQARLPAITGVIGAGVCVGVTPMTGESPNSKGVDAE